MMKKKNVAMAMAAVTAASAVAPVVANAAETTPKYEINNNSVSSLVKQLKGLLEDTYMTEGVKEKESVYKIILSHRTSGTGIIESPNEIDQLRGEDVNNLAEIEAVLAQANEDNTPVTIRIEKKGKTVVDDKNIIAEEYPTYANMEALVGLRNSIEDSAKALLTTTGAITDVKLKGEELKITIGVKTELSSGDTIDNLKTPTGVDVFETVQGVSTGVTITKEITVKVGDKQLEDIENTTGAMLKVNGLEGYQVISEYMNGDSVGTATAQTLVNKVAKIAGFKVKPIGPVGNRPIAEITVKPGTYEEVKVDASSLLDGGILSSEGQKLVDFIGSTYKVTNAAGETTVATVKHVFGDTIRTVTTDTRTNSTTSYELDLELIEDGFIDKTLTKVTLSAPTKDELVKFKKMINDGDDAQVVSQLAGGDRFETAIAISKETVKEETDAVVLVGSGAVVDGLAAGPLAAQLDTSILLSGQKSVRADIMDEIERVLNLEETKVSNLKNKTVYIVGGDQVIEDSVLEQISKKFVGINVERIAGEDRFETSTKIAELIAKKAPEGKSASTKAYVVGGYGLADAMSISAVAAQQDSNGVVSPIIVVNKEGLDDKTLATMLENYKTVDVIGGVEVVKPKVEEQLADLKVTRVSGLTREATNAAVINKYFKAVNTSKVFVANNGFVKDIAAKGDDQMIDAMTVAPLAGKMEAPILLAGNELTEEQQDAVELRINTDASVTKTGGAVVKAVLENVGKLIGFIK